MLVRTTLLSFAILLLPPPMARAVSPSCATAKCHADLAQGKSVHGPVKAKGCDVCHDIQDRPGEHPSVATRRKADANKDCLVCHDGIKHTMQAKLGISHAPINKDGCVSCHDPHHAEHAKLLKADPGQLCLKCHNSIHNSASAALAKHPPVLETKQCLNCHQPHASLKPGLLKGDEKGLCLGCHKDLAKWISEREVVHGPIQEGRCVACHTPHGGKEPQLLKGSYSKAFYVKYDGSQFQLCANCHDPMNKTSFKNGDLNLHSVHLRQDKKGRSCRACHEVHASHSPRLIRDEMHYLDVKVPLKFTKSSSGGQCATACHKVRVYDRAHEVKNESGR